MSDLLVGMQYGGSDAFSGVSANPSAGYAADMFVQAGATVMFSEVTEVRDGVHLIAERCISAEVRDKLAAEMRWYDAYLDAGEKTIQEVGTELFNFILDVASGIKKPYTEQYGLYNFMCIFNPAPIT